MGKSFAHQHVAGRQDSGHESQTTKEKRSKAHPVVGAPLYRSLYLIKHRRMLSAHDENTASAGRRIKVGTGPWVTA
jgi:hypothetical protein